MPVPSYDPNACPTCSLRETVDERRQYEDRFELWFQCSDCDCRWSVRYELTDEYLAVHQEGESMTENNPFMLESNDEHTFRRLVPTGGPRYECTVCGKEFYTKDAARKHWREKELSDEFNDERR